MTSKSEWILEKELGSGGYCIIELWRNRLNNNALAIKRYKKGALFTPQQKRWTKEVEMLQKLKHDNIIKTLPLPQEIVKLLDYNLPILCMEYCDEGDLRSMLQMPKNCCGFEEQEAFNIMRDVSSAVKYLHENKIIHRDLKPENIVQTRINNKIRYKLIDLGFAKEVDESFQYESLFGTLNYIAPEIWTKEYSCSVDYWSLGILFSEILTGRRPFLPDEENPRTWIKEIYDKPYDAIGAYIIDKRICYRYNIGQPALISQCIQPKLINWFKIVFQLDPKQRGKHPKNPNDLVVFSLLDEILNTKIIHIFLTPLYKIGNCIIQHDTSVGMIKDWISKICDIQTTKLVLINDSKQTILDNPEEKIVQNDDEVKSLFIAFEMTNENLKYRPFYASQDLNNITFNPKFTLENNNSVKQYCREIIFTLQKEMDLCNNCVMSLNWRIGINIQTVNLLQKEILKSKKDDLISQAEQIIQSVDRKEISEMFYKSVKDFLFKIREMLPSIKDAKKVLSDEQKLNEKLQDDLKDAFIKDNHYGIQIKNVLNLFLAMYNLLNKEKQNKRCEDLQNIVKTVVKSKDIFFENCSHYIKRIAEHESKLFKISHLLKSYASVENEYFKELRLLQQQKAELVKLYKENTSSIEESTKLSECDSLIFNSFLIQRKYEILLNKMKDI